MLDVSRGRVRSRAKGRQSSLGERGQWTEQGAIPDKTSDSALSADLSAAGLSKLLSRAYAKAPFKQRLMAWGRPWIAPVEAVLAEIPPNSRQLDMGCGVGFLLLLSSNLRGAGPVTGVDVDKAGLELARGVLREHAPGRRKPHLCTLQEWNAAPQSGFDVVTMVDVMHHVPWTQRQGFLKDLFGRVRPGGLFIYKDIAQKPRWAAIANFLHDLILTGERVRLSPVADIEAVAAQCGMRLTKSSKMFRLWYCHELRVFERA